MPLSNRIIRGTEAEKLQQWDFNAVGPITNNPVERLYQQLGTSDAIAKPAVALSPEEQRLHDWEQRLLEREQAITALEQQTLEQAQQTGQQRGYDAGWEAAHHERVNLLQATESVQQEFRAFQAELGNKVLDLACLVARKVLGDSIALHPEHSLIALTELLHTMNLESTQVTLLAHKTTLEVLQSQFGDAGELSGIKLREDNSLMQGGFKLQHPEGEVDASMETRWARTLESLGRTHIALDEPPLETRSEAPADSSEESADE